MSVETLETRPHVTQVARPELPRIVRMRFADVDDEERGGVAVNARRGRLRAGTSRTEGRSSVAAEDENDRLPAPARMRA